MRKEFASRFHQHQPQFRKLGMDGPAFEKWFKAELEKNGEFGTLWIEYEQLYERYKEFFSRRFHHQGTGDWNLFKLFLENNLTLIRPGGRLSLLIPSSIQTDEGCRALRKLLVTRHTLEELTSFENRGYETVENGKTVRKQIFPDVDSRFKFGFLKVHKDVPTPHDHVFDGRFYLHDPAAVTSPPIKCSVAMMEKFSPLNISLMEFRSASDYALCSKLRAEHQLLGELDYQFRRELHMTGDSGFFKARGGRKLVVGELPLLEGKMIHQFDGQYSPAVSYVLEKEVREELLRKEVFRLVQFIREQAPDKFEGEPVPKKKAELEKRLRKIFADKGFKLQYECERLAYREVANSTNERTLIAALLKAKQCLAHTLMYLSPYQYEVDAKGRLSQTQLEDDEVFKLLCLLNSFVLNYYVRNKVSSHVSIFQLNELPIPKISPAQRKKLAASAAKLLKNPHDVAERAKLEVFIARELYGLSAEDWRHLTGTFTFGGDSETKAELDEIIRQSHALWPK